MVAADAFSHALTNPLLSPNVYNASTFTAAGMDVIKGTSTLNDILARQRRGAGRGGPFDGSRRLSLGGVRRCFNGTSQLAGRVTQCRLRRRSSASVWHSPAPSRRAPTPAVFLDFLIQALEEWEKARDEPNIPQHRTGIKVIAGASAGAITGAVGLVALSRDLDLKSLRPAEIATADPQSGYNELRCVLPKLYTAWVVRPRMVASPGGKGGLLSLDDLEGTGPNPRSSRRCSIRLCSATSRPKRSAPINRMALRRENPISRASCIST